MQLSTASMPRGPPRKVCQVASPGERVGAQAGLMGGANPTFQRPKLGGEVGCVLKIGWLLYERRALKFQEAEREAATGFKNKMVASGTAAGGAGGPQQEVPAQRITTLTRLRLERRYLQRSPKLTQGSHLHSGTQPS